MKIHLNWSGCSDWNTARAKLVFLKSTLYGNFTDTETDDIYQLVDSLKLLGFKLTNIPSFEDEDARFLLGDA